MCAVVARRRGTSIEAVATEPYAAVLYEWDAGNEVDEVAAVLAFADDILRARMTACAFHEPKKLPRFDRLLRQRAARLSQAATDEALERAARMMDEVAKAERILRRQRKG